ncbi:unnamed protein product [Effrenium voratum]|nr:unnamed protein product [Effrenium voratum]
MAAMEILRPEGPASMSHLYFPPRGMPRPTLTQVLSEPDLRKEFFQHELTGDRLQHRREWMELMNDLDKQVAQRKQDQKRRVETEVALIRARQAHQRSEQAVSLQSEKPAWNYPEPMEYFERPTPRLMEASNTFTKNNMLMGIFDTPHDKPAHWEFDAYPGWAPFIHCASLAKDARVKPLAPKEKMYQERLERKLKRAKALERQDALRKTDGAMKKKALEENADEFSCLKREKPAWADQAVYTHEFFSKPEKPKHADYYETGIDKHVQQPERAMSFARDIIAGEGGRKSFWKEPSGGAVKGRAIRALRAKALLCPRGCSGMQEDLARAAAREEMRKTQSRTPNLKQS